MGAEMQKNNITTPMQVMIFKGLKFMPLVIFPFIANFPGAVLMYWTTTNAFTLVQATALNTNAVRKALNIPIIVRNPRADTAQSKGMIEAAQDAWKNYKTTSAVQDRRRYDEIQFTKAGHGPTVKTFKYDPTKKVPKTSKGGPISVKATIKKSS